MIASVDVASTVKGATAVPTTAVISSSTPLPVIVAVMSPVNDGAIESWNLKSASAVSLPSVSQPLNVSSLASSLIVNSLPVTCFLSLVSTPRTLTPSGNVIFVFLSVNQEFFTDSSK